eukprot:COSAG02_NODE_1444_length_12574_cov_17.452171_10_plen_171_part_00
MSISRYCLWLAACILCLTRTLFGPGTNSAFNTHRHAWPLVSLATSLVGIVFTQDGATIRPAGLPQELGAFAFTSRLANVSRRDDGSFAGTLLPLRKTAACVVTLELPHDEMTAADLLAARLRTPRARLIGGRWRNAELADEKDRHNRKVLRVALNVGTCGGELGGLEWQF